MPPTPASAIAPAALCAAFNASFADYLIGPPTLTPAQWGPFLARQGVDLAASFVVLDADAAVQAFALVGPQPGRSRLAVMGALPAARGSGAARAVLDAAIAAAAARGDRSIELEVFERNGRALALYRSRGFEPVAELHGWSRAADAPPAAAADAPLPAAVDLLEAITWLDAHAPDGLPYQVSGACLAASAPPLVAWREGAAQLVYGVRGEVVLILSLLDTTAHQHDARALLRRLAAAHPGVRLVMPQLQRADCGGRAFAAEGWLREPLHQLLMRLPLPGP